MENEKKAFKIEQPNSNTVLMKLDYNNFIRQVGEAVQKADDPNNWFIVMGFALLNEYMKSFAEIAIERGDAELISLCRDLNIIKDI